MVFVQETCVFAHGAPDKTGTARGITQPKRAIQKTTEAKANLLFLMRHGHGWGWGSEGRGSSFSAIVA